MLKISIVMAIVIAVGLWLWRLAGEELRHNERVTRGKEPPIVDAWNLKRDE